MVVSGSLAVAVSATSSPPSTVAVSGDTEAIGLWFSRTRTFTSAACESCPAPSSVTVRVSTMSWAAAVFSGAVQIVSRSEASRKLPPPELVQA